MFNYIKENPFVSIIIPVFNSQCTLGETIISVISQTYKNWELIIIDDGSKDNSRFISQSFCKTDNRIKYIYQENSGSASARNTGIKNSLGKYIRFLDSDDLFLPDSTEKLIESIKEKDNIKFIYGNYIILNTQKNSKTIIQLPEPQKKPFLYFQQLIGNIIPTGSVLIEKELLLKTDLFNPEFKIAQDYDLWNQIIYLTDIYKLEDPLYIYKIHNKQISKNSRRVKYFSDKVSVRFFNQIKDHLENDYYHNKKEYLAEIYFNYGLKLFQKSDKLNTSLELIKESNKLIPDNNKEKYIKEIVNKMEKDKI